MDDFKPWAILPDLSGVQRLNDGQGGFYTKQQALERLIELLEVEHRVTTSKLIRARKALYTWKHRDEKSLRDKARRRGLDVR